MPETKWEYIRYAYDKLRRLAYAQDHALALKLGMETEIDFGHDKNCIFCKNYEAQLNHDNKMKLTRGHHTAALLYRMQKRG